MMAIFSSAGVTITREQVSQWLKKDSDADFAKCLDVNLACFLNGFINEKRGKKDGAQAIPETRLTNNIILTKIKIALNLKAEELITLLEQVDFRLSKPELTAFSRKPEHKNYRECKDQVLRNLLQAMDKRYHVERSKKIDKPAPIKKAYVKQPKKPKDEGPRVDGARPNASAIYVNPKTNTPTSNTSGKPNRSKLKLNK